MAGRPKKRARLAALKASKAEGMAAIARSPHTIPMRKEAAWVETPEPVAAMPPIPPITQPRQKPQEDAPDPLIANILPAAAAEADAGEMLAAKAEAYNTLLKLSLERAVDIMQMKPHHTCSKCGFEDGDPAYDSKVMARQASIVSSMLSTTARIDEARLRGQGKNRIGELLDELRKIKPAMN